MTVLATFMTIYAFVLLASWIAAVIVTCSTSEFEIKEFKKDFRQFFTVPLIWPIVLIKYSLRLPVTIYKKLKIVFS